MGIFSRIGDILSSNINAMLDKAEDPEKIARLIIQEMEDTLVEVRTTAARSIADKKELIRRVERADAAAAEWDAKAALAIEKGRDDLARGALVEKQKQLRMRDTIARELEVIEAAIEKANDDMAKLQDKLDEAKAKHKALMLRRSTAEDRIRVRDRIVDTKIEDALSRYETVERKVDQLEAEVEAYDLGRGMTLANQFAELEAQEEVEAELAALKQRVRPARAAKPAKSAASTPASGETDA